MNVLRAKITKRAVDGVPIPSQGEARLWDTDLKGFLLRVYPSGRRVYAVKCRVGRVQHVHTIGEHGSPWSPDEARKAASEALQKARAGQDPSALAQTEDTGTFASLSKMALAEVVQTKGLDALLWAAM